MPGMGNSHYFVPSMYIILEGRCAVYIDASKTGEDEVTPSPASSEGPISSRTLSSRTGSRLRASTPLEHRHGSRLTLPPKSGKKLPRSRPSSKSNSNVHTGDQDAPDHAEAVMGEVGATVSLDVPVIAIDVLIDGEVTQDTAEKEEKKFNINDYGKYIMTFSE